MMSLLLTSLFKSRSFLKSIMSRNIMPSRELIEIRCQYTFLEIWKRRSWMNDGKLSQEESDALLNIDNEDSHNSNDEDSPKYELSTEQMDALGEVGNISFGSSATTLSTLLDQKVEITTPTVRVVEKEELET